MVLLWASIQEVVCVSSPHNRAQRQACACFLWPLKEDEKGCAAVGQRGAEQPAGGCEGCQWWLAGWELDPCTSYQFCWHLLSSRAREDQKFFFAEEENMHSYKRNILVNYFSSLPSLPHTRTSESTPRHFWLEFLLLEECWSLWSTERYAIQIALLFP